MRVAEMPVSDRPRERMLEGRPEALTNVEVLAIVLGTGTAGVGAVELAGRLWAEFGSWERLSRASPGELRRTPGIGPAKAAHLMAALEAGRRFRAEGPASTDRVMASADVFRRLEGRYRGAKQEEFVVLLLSGQNRLLREQVLFRGTLTASLVHPREIFALALGEAAAGIICAHNHPSGDPTPSPEDIALTRKLAEAGRLLDIPLLDHVILGAGCHVSLAERGMLR